MKPAILKLVTDYGRACRAAGRDPAADLAAMDDAFVRLGTALNAAENVAATAQQFLRWHASRSRRGTALKRELLKSHMAALETWDQATKERP